jgi:hypothetical protein
VHSAKPANSPKFGIGKALGITQDSVSRLEQRSDLLLSTLRKTVKAMGGNLSLIAEFPDRAPVVLAGIAAESSRCVGLVVLAWRAIHRAAASFSSPCR